MAVSPARNFAYDILIRVERDGSYASELLNAPRMDTLSREDRALTYELVMSTLRWQSELDARIAKYSSQKVARLDGEVRVALRLGACQLYHLERIPAHAAVHESVELVKQSGKRSAVPYANAVLRKLAANAKPAGGGKDPHLLAAANAGRLGGETPDPHIRQRQANMGHPASVVEEVAAEFAHPEWMVARWIDMYGYNAARAICAADQHAPGSALRLCTGDAEEELIEAGIRIAPGALLTGARRLLAGDLAHSIPFRDHHVAVQDEGVATGGRAGGKRGADIGLLRGSGRKDGGDCGAQSGGADHCGGTARTSRKGAERAGCRDEREGCDRQCGGDGVCRKVRPRAGRRALQRHGNAGEQSGDQVAAEGGGFGRA